MVTLLASWRWLRLPAYTAGYPGAMLQAMTYANASRGRTCNKCLQPHVERQDKAGYRTSHAKESCGTAWSIRRSGPCSPLHAPYRRDVHWWESRTTYVPLPTALAGNTNENFSRSRRLQHLCLVSFVTCFVFVPSVEQPQESC